MSYSCNIFHHSCSFGHIKLKFALSGHGWEELPHLLRDAGRSSLAAEAGVLSARSGDLLLPQSGGRGHDTASPSAVFLRRWRERRDYESSLSCGPSSSPGRRLRYSGEEWRRGLPASACCHGDPALQPWRPVSDLQGPLLRPAPGQRLLPETWGDIPQEVASVSNFIF